MADAPEHALDRLAACQRPLLIGVRHHSAVVARAVPELLSAFKPEAVLVEMPPDFEPWLPYLARGELQPPVALAACLEGRLVSFYPLADFSPELAAIRWAARHGAPVKLCDLDVGRMAAAADRHSADAKPAADGAVLDSLLRRVDARGAGELWEQLVEAPAAGASPESIRRAALLFGWLMRRDAGGATLSDALREKAMREVIAAAPSRSAAVVGSFHAAALLPEPLRLGTPPRERPDPLPLKSPPGEACATALIPYSFTQLDQRSGYPAGVMDPVWQQQVHAAKDAADIDGVVSRLAVGVCRRLRRDGHTAGAPDAMEIARLTRDLSRLRGKPAPGRGELLEAIESTLVQGELLGRGRAVATAAQAVLIGDAQGRLPPGTPRSGLAVDVEATLATLKLPGPSALGKEPRVMRLDPLRSKLDRRRAVTLRRLALVGVHYAERTDAEAIGDRENLTEAWRVTWTHATAATLESAGLRGVTLGQAAEAAVRRLSGTELPPTGADADLIHPAAVLARLTAAAECGLTATTRGLLGLLSGGFLHSASMAELVEAADLVRRIAAGHIAALPLGPEQAAPPDVDVFGVEASLLAPGALVETALRRLDGLRGSDDAADVDALVDLAGLIQANGPGLAQAAPAGRSSLLGGLVTRLRRFASDGSPRMEGAASGCLARLGADDADTLAARLSSWFDAASGPGGRRRLNKRLAGLLAPLYPLLASEPSWLGGLDERLSRASDEAFFARLPSMRGGFSTLAPAERVRLLEDRLGLLDPSGLNRTPAHQDDDPVLRAAVVSADRASRTFVAELMPELRIDSVVGSRRADRAPEATQVLGEPPGELPLAERWSLVLGVEGGRTPTGRRAAAALDELYGASAREGLGPRGDLASGRGGQGAAAPSAREWVAEVDRLFGAEVCEEVLGEAAQAGRLAVLAHLDPDGVRPSVELLTQVLSLRGGLPEREFSVLRRLASRIAGKLAEQLANRLSPALTGLSTPRPSRRRNRRIDFGRTIARNLDAARRRDDGSLAIAAREMVYRSPARRQMDWHLIFVTDVSGSMEASVVYSALVAAIFSALPAIDVRLFAFSTELVDLSDTVDDPLSLLLEVRVGGGTRIGLGLRAAREAVRNPTRTLVVLVTDFEEGFSMPEVLTEVRALADAGVTLLGLASLGDDAAPRYHAGNAALVSGAGMPVAAVSPERLAQWVGDVIRNARR